MVDPAMVTWAQVVLLMDHPRRPEAVQAYRIMAAVRPRVYVPPLARALADLVDDFTDAAPPDAVRTLLAEAATALRGWAADLVREGVPLAAVRRAGDGEGPHWDILAAAVVLEEAGRRDAALAAIQQLVELERAHRTAPPSRLGLALLHLAGMLERRERSYDAAAVREEASRLLAAPRREAPRSDAIAAMLTATVPPPRGPRPAVVGGSHPRTPLRSR